jgi:hypothetical protein
MNSFQKNTFGEKKDYWGVLQRLSSTESILGTSKTMSVEVMTPASLLLSMTGKVLTFFCAMSLAASSTVADSLMVTTGEDMICLAVKARGAKH